MRLIDADALMREYQDKVCFGVFCVECPMTDEQDGTCLIERWIYAQPTIDAVEIVRCRDCKWAEPTNDGWNSVTCNFYGETTLTMPTEGFCSYGDRIE